MQRRASGGAQLHPLRGHRDRALLPIADRRCRADVPLARVLLSRSLPLLGEYPRLIRSLGYAYVWERWPDTLTDRSGTR